MTKKILVAYATNAGSTVRVANIISEELKKAGAQVDSRRVADVKALQDYDAVVVGGPLIMGWHRHAMKFLRDNQAVLSQKPVAYFITCLNLFDTGETTINGTTIYLDSQRAKTPGTAGKLSMKEKQGDPAHILRGIAAKTPQIKPLSAGFFGGKLDFSKLSFLQKLFVRFIIRHEAGDFRNWDAIREWAGSLYPTLSGE